MRTPVFGDQNDYSQLVPGNKQYVALPQFFDLTSQPEVTKNAAAEFSDAAQWDLLNLSIRADSTRFL